MKYFFSIVFSVVFSHYIFAQTPVGTWRDHLPYNAGKVVAYTGNRVYCATDLALFYYDIEDNAVFKLSKINKLSDLEPGYIAYNKPNNKLIIGYMNGNIDVLEGDTKYNFPDIKIKNIIADKSIYHIMIYNDFAYLSTGFGIVVFNLKKNEFADTYIIGRSGSYSKINSTAIYNNEIFALTDNGVFKANLDDPFLGNFENWKKVTQLLNPNEKYTSSAVFGNKLLLVNSFANSDSCIVNAYNGVIWDTIFTNMREIKSLKVYNHHLTITKQWHVQVFNEAFERIGNFGSPDARDAIFDEKNNFWIANSAEGLVMHNAEIYKKTIMPNGPSSKNVFKVYNNNGSILVAPGGYGGSFIQANVFEFVDELWNNLTDKDFNKDSLIKLKNVVDFATSQNSKNFIAATYGYGIFEVKNGQIQTFYNSENTNGKLGNYIGGLTYDNNGNLYLVANYIEKPFIVKTKDNNWYSYSYDGSWIDTKLNSSIKLINTNNNDKWTISPRGKGIFVYNDNATPEYEADDIYKNFELKDEANSIIDTRLNDIVQDVEGTIWIATGSGIAVYDYPEYVLNGDRNFYARRPQIVVDGYLKGLLEGENVTSVAVDGANRKWLGTEGGGLFLVSPDGTEQLMIWNIDNSKLLSNNIVSLSINQKTGEVFIGTDKGMQSYKSTATENKADYSEIYAFPNPVKGDFNGIITIRGLMYKSNVKITDLAGNLVFETISNGGDAIWNGKDMSGEKVAPGIYLVMCAQDDASASEVTKILFIK